MSLIEIENSGTATSPVYVPDDGLWGLAQTFTPTDEFILNTGSVYGCNVGVAGEGEPIYAEGNIRIEIWDRRPTSTVDFTGRLAYYDAINADEFPLRWEQPWPWPFAWADFVFSTDEPVTLAVGHTYWLVRRNESLDPEKGNICLASTGSNNYTAGSRFFLSSEGETVYISSSSMYYDLQFKLGGPSTSKIQLVSPVDNATEVRSKDILTAKVVDLGESVVSSVQLYLNNVKVYDGGPQGAKPYLQWMVGVYCQPNTEYDWYVTATIDDVEYQSDETWTFTTAEKQDLHPSFHWWGSTPTWSESPSIPAYSIYFGTDPTGADLDLIVEDWVEPEWEWSEGEWTGGAGGNWTAVGSGDGTPAEPDWSWYPLEYDTDYYWKIDDGPVYTFTTMAFYTPQWETKYLRLVAAANNKIYYEDV